LTISVFYLGSNGTASNLTAAATLRDIPRQIQQLTPGGVDIDAKAVEIVGFHVVTPSEASSDVHAVVVTSKGLRLYLSHRKTSSYGYGYPSYSTSSANEQPTSLRIIYVRGLPVNLFRENDSPSQMQVASGSGAPGPEIKPFQITHITDTFYSCGLFIASQPPPPVQDGSDSILLCTFPDAPSIAGLKQVAQPQPIFGQPHPSYHRPTLTENIKLLPLQGESWAIAELPQPSHSKAFNELSSQFSQAQRELVVLSHVGVTPVSKLRPADILYQLIQQDKRYELELFCGR
jgi:nuclear pore complex protein Nup155